MEAVIARIRTIKPEFVESESIGELSRDARLLFVQLWTFVDDLGRARASSRLLASRLYPYDEDAPDLIDGWLGELVNHGHVRLYEDEGHIYLDIPKWLEHQKIDHPSKSRLPEFREDLAKPRESVAPHTLDLGPVPGPVPSTDSSADADCVTPEHVTQAFAMFNDSAKRTGWPEAQKIDDDRRKAMRGRLREVDGVEGFAIALGKAEASQFLTETWPNFNIDWLLKPKNFRKLMEGNYDKRIDAVRPAAGSVASDFAGAAAALRDKQYHGL